MYELSRVRLHSVGPSGARYQDVVLDFSDVGDVVRAPRQDALFGAGVHSTEAGLVRRPSPASVLFLENGGGKSVLLKLIFSVMLPGRRQVVGTTNTRVLEKFVGGKDVAHVVLEWQHTETGERVVTGKVSEWRGHVASSDPANLIDAWYCFRPSSSLGLNSLPFTQDGRLLTMSAFHERLTRAHTELPELELCWTRRHHEWTERLDQLGLDPELFRYQRAMNAGEGEAADAFAFGTDGAFVEFLLKAVLQEEESKDLAEVVATYAGNLAQRGELLVERDFVAGALDLLTPLAEEEALAAASRRLAETARAELAELAGAVAERDRAEQDRLAGLRAHVEEIEAAERLAEGDHRRRAGEVAQLRGSVARLLLDDALAARDRVDAELEPARVEARAWRETETVLAHGNASRRAADLRVLVGSREQKAKPALLARDAAAAALARGLLALARRADEQVDEAEREAARLRSLAEHEQAERDEATSVAAGRQAEADALEARVVEVREELTKAAGEGLLAARPDPAAVPEAARQAAAQRERSGAELSRREAELERVLESAATAQAEVNEAQRAEAAASDGAQRAAQELASAQRRTDRIAAEPRLSELLATEHVTLETDTPALLELLREARGTAEREQTALRIEESLDERVLGALGSGGLLPPPQEVQRVLDVLEADGITGWSGWRYLSTLPPPSRAEVLRRVPHLAAGVLLNEADQLPRARQVLERARPLPGAAIAVGLTSTVSALSEGAADPAPAEGVEFVVPPNPAMYDEDAADAEREAVARRQARRRGRLAELERAVAADAALLWQLTAWREDYPPGAVAVLAEQARARAAEYTAARQQTAEAEAALERLRAKRDELRERVPSLRRELREAEERARRLAELAERAARLTAWTEEATRAREAAEHARERAHAAGTRAARLREQAAEWQRSADEHRRTAASARAELAEVPGAGPHEDGGEPAEPAEPAEPVETLRRAYAGAADTYAKVAVGSDLRAELEHAEHAEAAARAAVEGLDTAVRERAGELLRTPDGSDASARAAARSRAERAVAALEDERADVIALVATRKAELDRLPGHGAPPDAVERPRDIEHGRELIEAASAELSAASRELEELRDRKAGAQATLESARASAAGFALLAESLAPHVPRGEPTGAYDAELDTARARHTELAAALARAQEAVDTAEQRVRAQADALAQYATERRFERLTTPVRQQIVSVRRDSLPAHARQWQEALRPRLRTLTDDLTQIDRHRDAIVTRLGSLVEGALRTLRSAQRVSRLPDGLGDWSGQEFLRIRFTELDGGELAQRLGEVVDEAAAGRTADGREVRRDGLSLLLRGVRVAVPKGFRVDMLKPDSVLRTERQRVSEIRDVFSGGQQLTAAIILYCTLAALRANSRGRMRSRHSGVLFLDNPIGRASAGYLLELQRSVAEALGVQLVYTTGLFDAGALSEFPLIIRLRNDADLRAGRKYLSVDDTIRKELVELGEPDGVGRLSATRLYAKPDAPG